MSQVRRVNYAHCRKFEVAKNKRKQRHIKIKPTPRPQTSEDTSNIIQYSTVGRKSKLTALERFPKRALTSFTGEEKGKDKTRLDKTRQERELYTVREINIQHHGSFYIRSRVCG